MATRPVRNSCSEVIVVLDGAKGRDKKPLIGAYDVLDPMNTSYHPPNSTQITLKGKAIRFKAGGFAKYIGVTIKVGHDVLEVRLTPEFKKKGK